MHFHKITHNEISSEHIIQPIFSDYIKSFVPYVNELCYTYSQRSKQLIEDNFKDWEFSKKITNPYEYIHTPYNKGQCVSKETPISRAYYKMIEILEHFQLLKNYHNDFMNSFHLAEGPGGFIEAIAKRRNNMLDSYYGMTLISDERSSIPGWNKIEKIMNTFTNISIEKGSTGTGDLFSPENLSFVREKYGNTMDIVTGDGGFDFSVDFNKQELYAVQLIFSQMMFAINLQKIGGHFVLKVFDTYSKSMVDIIYLLSCFYKETYICKPHTSRLANSEKYIVCKDFIGVDEKVNERLISIYQQQCVMASQEKYMSSILIYEHSLFFKNEIKQQNSLFGQQQIENINQTINLIYKGNTKTTKIHELEKKHIQLCIDWCKKYSVMFNDVKKKNLFLEN
jgi:23S rRNA U2552 (ribose-2'-O)-methylase RlmE/FtsJ